MRDLKSPCAAFPESPRANLLRQLQFKKLSDEEEKNSQEDDEPDLDLGAGNRIQWTVLMSARRVPHPW